MFAYIKGVITFKNPTFIVVETAGVGYHINISLNTYSEIEPLANVKILTYLHVKEDSQNLFGFASEVERTLFIQLLSVSGIGPNTARILLSSMKPDEAKAAIIAEDVPAFKKVKGIGPKTAKLIILDLKDKILRDSGDSPISFSQKDNTIRDEALSALVALGFAKIRIQKVLNSILKDQKQIDNVEQLIKEALKKLS